MITIFTPSFADEADSNAQNHTTREIVARLDSSRFAVTMLCGAAPDLRIARRPNTRLLKWGRRGNTVRTAWHLLRNPPDIYFFPREGPLDMAFLTMRRGLGLKTALVSYVVSGGLATTPYPPARERHIREANLVIANNRHLGRLLKEKMGIEVGGTIYDAVDRSCFFPPADARAGRDSVAVLFAGSLRPYKRAPIVVRQAARWPQAQFRIAGAGEEEQICRKLASDLGCRNVEFLGHLTHDQLGKEMRHADIFLFPSVVEGHPQVLVQAAASGLPVIAMKLYQPDYVVDGATGFLVADDDELAEKLDRLIVDPGLRQQMSTAAVEHAQKFDWDGIARAWQDVFESAVAQRRRG